MIEREFWRGKSVLLTGHTGFKGSWLALRLIKMGARVHGYALLPPTSPNMFDLIGIKDDLASHTISDIRDAEAINFAFHKSNPEIIIHMAAQPIVRDSYKIPSETYSVNVMGTVNVLEAVRKTDSVRAVVCVTTDKCYENKEWIWGYRENEPLGGYDPYSSSKACAELAVASWRRSFFGGDDDARIATARAGNVIGGGDWANDRLIPDCIRAATSGEKIIVRSPSAVRPWQHVLEPLSGYITLAQKLHDDGHDFSEAWNFGPGSEDEKSVGYIVEQFCMQYGTEYEILHSHDQPHEAAYLKLDSSKARVKLQWQPKWNIAEAIKKTVEWVKIWYSGEDVRKISEEQIEEYTDEKRTAEWSTYPL